MTLRATPSEAGAWLHVVYVNYWYEPAMASLDDLLETYATMSSWVEALHSEQVDVTVFQRFSRNARLVHGGVEFVLHRDGLGPHLLKWQWPLSFHRLLQNWTSGILPETQAVAHFNGLHFPLQLRSLRASLPGRFAIVVQNHAERPARGLRRTVQRWGLRAADGFFFAAADQASAWIDDKIIRTDQPVYQVMEGSTDFRRHDRATARARSGICGDPVLLWVGRLIPLKDPLTVLRGFEMIVRKVPMARLYMIYGDDELLPEVRNCITQSRLLSASVTLLGFRPHAELESLYNSADYFVLGSHYEGSGYALAEALACGVVPVVTNIASFRALTDGGRIGACWAPGDGGAFAAAFERASMVPHQAQSAQAVRFFEDRLSFPAIARQAIAAYRELALKRTGHTR